MMGQVDLKHRYHLMFWKIKKKTMVIKYERGERRKGQVDLLHWRHAIFWKMKTMVIKIRMGRKKGQVYLLQWCHVTVPGNILEDKILISYTNACIDRKNIDCFTRPPDRHLRQLPQGSVKRQPCCLELKEYTT